MSTRDLLVFEGGRTKRKTTGADTFTFSANRLKVATPTALDDATSKEYVDSIAAGFDPKDAVDLATVAVLPANTAAGSGAGKTLTADANGALSVDGTAVTAGQRILVKDETPNTDNGIYVVTAAGSAGTPYILTRSTDLDGAPAAEVSTGAYTLVAGGATLSATNWYITSGGGAPIVVDTGAIVWGQASSPGSTPDATSASGGAVKGKVTVDSDNGLTVSTGILSAKVSGQGIDFVSTNIALKLDGSTLTQSGSGAKVATDGITSTELASNSVVLAKLASNSVDENKITASVAGGGLTGGGGSALAVGAGTYITVNANDVTIDTTALATFQAGDGLTDAAGVMAVGAGDGITVTANAVALASTSGGAGLTYTTGVLAVGAGTHITVNVDDIAVNAASLATAFAGDGLTDAAGVMAVGAGDGITVTANAVALSASTGGAGLTYTTGVLAVVAGLDGASLATIAVGANDISVDYTMQLTNNTAFTVNNGQVVTFTPTGGILIAADKTGASLVDAQIGVVIGSIAVAATGTVSIRRGAMVPTPFGGLTPGVLVYVNAGGDVTQSLAGFSVGDHVYRVGRAHSATRVQFNPEYIMEY